ncbi:hypothetical protein TSUD_362840 [Trifolium subterraneum]|uniref:Reverse transcriptase zinc-binding domain-containing protein n=1 Tax=Trifolium subterraneum TaxID=3900 RepID=A0A2Z6N5V8_TRISU|nr:hypothetical protein TSUD_362840 [Trifolium subterraneum]
MLYMYDPSPRGNEDHWVSSPQVEGVYHLFVKDLFLGNYNARDIAKIRNLFIGLVVEEIIATPLISSVKEDKVVWEEEMNGGNSVKSGYNLPMTCLIRSDRNRVEGNWNGIWKGQSPHKAHYLLWRLYRGCLPTRQHASVGWQQRHNVVPVEDPRPVQWEKPSVRWIKYNVDAAFVVEGESWVLLHVMKEVIHNGFERGQFQSDSKLLVDAIHSRRQQFRI